VSIKKQLREQRRAREITGHDIMALERFMEDTHHMIIFDVLTSDCPVGDKGKRARAFLTDEGYQQATESETRGEMKIIRHARVIRGALRYDAPDIRIG
jgi:hypothetical protein